MNSFNVICASNRRVWQATRTVAIFGRTAENMTEVRAALGDRRRIRAVCLMRGERGRIAEQWQAFGRVESWPVVLVGK